MRALPWTGGKVRIAGGEAVEPDQDYPSSTVRTLLFDPRSEKFSEGPELPAAPRRGGIFGLPDGGALLVSADYDKCRLHRFRAGTWTAGKPLDALGGSFEWFQTRNRTVHFTMHKTGEVLRADAEKLTVEKVGTLGLNHSSSAALELDDGRVVFVGGDLYNNIDAEPELWDPKTGEGSPLPGWEREYARQKAALAKYRAKAR